MADENQNRLQFKVGEQKYLNTVVGQYILKSQSLIYVKRWYIIRGIMYGIFVCLL